MNGVTWKSVVGVLAAVVVSLLSWASVTIYSKVESHATSLAAHSATLAVIQYQFQQIHGELMDIKAQLRERERAKP